MANPYINKKKIRGWKRKILALERWKLNNINLDLDNLEKNKYDYVKIWIDPFYRLTKRNPPHWYKLKIIEAFSEIFASWEKALMRLGKKFYLKIWLYEPNFINSQIVCAIDERIEFYENTFNKSPKGAPVSIKSQTEFGNPESETRGIFKTNKNNETKTFPFDKFNNNQFLKSLKFELAIEDYYISSEDDFYTDSQMNKFKEKAYLTQNNGNTETLYFIKCGNVFIGDR